MNSGAGSSAINLWNVNTPLVLLSHAEQPRSGYPIHVPCGTGEACADFVGRFPLPVLPYNLIERKILMFSAFLVPDETVDDTIDIFCFENRDVGFLEWLLSHTRNCMIVITFAGVIPPFADMLNLPADRIHLVRDERAKS